MEEIMKNLIKIMMLVLALMLALVLVSCGKTDNTGNSGKPSKASEGLEMEYRENYEVNGIDLGSGYVVTGIGDCKDKNIVIPGEYDGKNVIGIESMQMATEMESIFVGSGVKYIGEYAFYGCKNLSDIELSDGIEMIEDISLDSTEFYKTKENWENGTLYVGVYLIDTNDDIPADFVIKSGTKVIASKAFDNSYNLRSVTIPNSVISIGNSAFIYCNSLTNVEFSNSVKFIGNEAFRYCDSLTNVVIPGCVANMGYNTFSDCDELKSVVISDGVTNIGESAFESCDALTSIEIPGSVINIKGSSFGSCESLITVTIVNGTKSIGDNAFLFCSELTTVTIPNSIEIIGESAFGHCYNLETINFNGTKSEWNSIDFGAGWDEANSYTIICTDGTITINK